MDMKRKDTLIGIVDDDQHVRNALQDLMESVGLTARCFGSAETFLESGLAQNAGCLITDIRLPGISGIELQRQLLARDCGLPVIFITAHGSDDHARSESASKWTVAYLIKPLANDDLLDAVKAAMKWQPGDRPKEVP